MVPLNRLASTVCLFPRNIWFYSASYEFIVSFGLLLTLGRRMKRDRLLQTGTEPVQSREGKCAVFLAKIKQLVRFKRLLPKSRRESFVKTV